MAVENIGAGYHTLAEAFSGWRDSPPHRANMLRSGVTKMGIAAVYAPGSKYKVFWALILAAPDDQAGITPKNQAFWANSGYAKAAGGRLPPAALISAKCRVIRCEAPNSVYSEQHYFRGSPDTMATQPAPAAKPKQNTVSLKHLAATLAATTRCRRSRGKPSSATW